MPDRTQSARPEPPAPPRTVEGLACEMLGTFDSCPALYQGMLRYWLMWRFPQIASSIQAAPGLKFHLCCASFRDLLGQFGRVLLLPDLLVVGQCGPLLQYEMLQYQHPLEHPWPRTDGTHASLEVIGGKADRPILDGLVRFIDECVRPLAPTGRVLVAPFATMLAGPLPTIVTPEAARAVVEQTMSAAKPDGLPRGITLQDAMEQARKLFDSGDIKGSVPLSELMGSDAKLNLGVADPNQEGVENRYGRFALRNAPISQPDPLWQPEDILAFEFLMATHFGAMLVVAGDWTRLVPSASYSLDLRIPYVDGVHPAVIAEAIADDPEVFMDFRKSISRALNKALAARGSQTFSKELARIQTDIIDAGVTSLNRKWRELCRRRLARIGRYAAGTIGITVGLYCTFSPAALAGLFSTAAASFFVELEKRISEQSQMKGEPMYFIWRLGR